jgi:hypothetical protein
MKLPDIALLFSLVPLTLAACDKENGDENAEEGNQEEGNQEEGNQEEETGTPADMAPPLLWYSTCGDPACSGYNGPWEGVPACGQITEGDPCEVEGETCDFMSECNAQMICATADPKQVEGGCPISRSRFKQDIRYLDADERADYYRQLLEIDLATYRYRERSDRKTQLGVILEDNEHGVWIDAANDRVDIYAYTSLAVAGVQTQAAELAALRREIDELRRELAQVRDHGCQPTNVSRLAK